MPNTNVTETDTQSGGTNLSSEKVESYDTLNKTEKTNVSSDPQTKTIISAEVEVSLVENGSTSDFPGIISLVKDSVSR